MVRANRTIAAHDQHSVVAAWEVHWRLRSVTASWRTRHRRRHVRESEHPGRSGPQPGERLDPRLREGDESGWASESQMPGEEFGNGAVDAAPVVGADEAVPGVVERQVCHRL